MAEPPTYWQATDSIEYVKIYHRRRLWQKMEGRRMNLKYYLTVLVETRSTIVATTEIPLPSHFTVEQDSVSASECAHRIIPDKAFD